MLARMRACAPTVVLADDHVLDGLTWAGHVHGVGQVRPAQAGVVGLRLEHLVRQEAHLARNVVILYCALRGRVADRVSELHFGIVQQNHYAYMTRA